MMISGTGNLIVGQRPSAYSYYFSRIPGCWGWATWRRAWQYYDMQMALWPALRDTSWLRDVLLADARGVEYWKNTFDKAHAGKGNVDYWDYQWTFACWAQSGLSIQPHTNLVCNIGFREDATHTRNPNSICANIPTVEMKFPLRHPPYVVWDRGADQIRYEHALQKRPHVYHRLRRKIAAAIPGIVRKPVLYLWSRYNQGSAQ